MKWLNKLERKFGKYYIPNLMWLVISLSALVYAVTYIILGNFSYVNKLVLSPQAIMNGEIWRLITFVLIPPLSGSIFMVALGLYFDYIVGTTLESVWGGFKFNVYFFVGMLSTILISFLTGMPATGAAVTLSIFLAFAKLFPEYTVLLFFIIPVKMKWLGYLAWAKIIFDIVLSLINGGGFTGIIICLVPIINYLLFFGKSNYKETKIRTGSVIRMSEYKKSIKGNKKEYRHKCAVCGITDKDDPNMLFRYCSKCKGDYAYCEKHIYDHEHIIE
ncbi:hypothetical protein JW813_10810 [Clostridium botulinum]|uniref:rhomboid family intramembrane serine protease n=1 Tax=Clostridium botulinum TaxID=1491 RepID=UPI001C9B4865|nr:rhomboid family intramembrane serine protease [Clostridium botulinum]MBY6810916.1 hypothetical protein [Clostridium botulinum]MBY6824384.1 hypothetical protein [Clostridium botulinum]MBY6834838.1 hypothetical protein [Clostridium botulinum]MBY6973117.1 hypothetical protein [Clostridium botulinum]UZP02209.1 hypothetical protein JW813_10810 [Clostridium botulinum]